MLSQYKDEKVHVSWSRTLEVLCGSASMSIIRETIVFDPNGDPYLVLERPDEASVNDETTRVVPAPDNTSQDNPVNVMITDIILPSTVTRNHLPVADVAADGPPL